jgi:hypothetical protein
MTQSDFSRTPDDASPIPAAPFSIASDVPAVDPDSPDNQADEIAENKEAAPRWHPAWDTVQERFEQEIASRNPAGGANTHRDLPAEEFKIRMIVDSDVVGILESIMEDVKRAVDSTEQRPKPAKQPSTKGR